MRQHPVADLRAILRRRPRIECFRNQKTSGNRPRGTGSRRDIQRKVGGLSRFLKFIEDCENVTLIRFPELPGRCAGPTLFGVAAKSSRAKLQAHRARTDRMHDFGNTAKSSI